VPALPPGTGVDPPRGSELPDHPAVTLLWRLGDAAGSRQAKAPLGCLPVASCRAWPADPLLIADGPAARQHPRPDRIAGSARSRHHHAAGAAAASDPRRGRGLARPVAGGGRLGPPLLTVCSQTARKPLDVPTHRYGKHAGQAHNNGRGDMHGRANGASVGYWGVRQGDQVLQRRRATPPGPLTDRGEPPAGPRHARPPLPGGRAWRLRRQ